MPTTVTRQCRFKSQKTQTPATSPSVGNALNHRCEKSKKKWLKKVYRALLLLKPYEAYKIAEMTDEDDILRIVGHKELPWTDMKYIMYAWQITDGVKVIQDHKIDK